MEEVRCIYQNESSCCTGKHIDEQQTVSRESCIWFTYFTAANSKKQINYFHARRRLTTELNPPRIRHDNFSCHLSL